MQMNFHRKLPIPKEVKKEFPLTERMEQVKAKRDESIRAVFDGSSDKFPNLIVRRKSHRFHRIWLHTSYI